jgi:hypothetical protein
VYAELESLALHVAKGQLKAPEKIGAAAASFSPATMAIR